MLVSPPLPVTIKDSSTMDRDLGSSDNEEEYDGSISDSDSKSYEKNMTWA